MNITNRMIIVGSCLSSLLLSASCSDTSSFKGDSKIGSAVSASDSTKATVPDSPETETTAEAESVVPIPIVSSATADNLFKDCNGSTSSKIQAELYRLPEGADNVPDFTSITSLRTICLNQLDITARDFTAGFPGVTDLYEWFALNINFNVNVPVEGDYSFYLTSDDGSLMSIDGQSVIQNDGTHGAMEKDVKIHLTAGSHAIHVGYFQGPKTQIALELKWIVPGSSEKVYLSEELLSRP